MKGRISPTQEVCNHIGTLPFGMHLLEGEGSVFLIALSWKAHIVELNLVRARSSGNLCQCYVVLLHLDARGIGPYQLSVLPPGLARFFGFHGQFRMGENETLVAEHGNSCNGMKTLGMQKSGVFWQVVNVHLVGTDEGMLERNRNL